MDWNTLLMWMAGMSCVMTIGASIRASPRLKGWIFVCTMILAIGVAEYVLLRQKAGFISGGLWAVFVLGPSLLQRSAAKWSVRQQYQLAAKFSAVAGILHPFDGMPQQSKYLHAMAIAERGEIETAIAKLQNLQTHAPARIARLAAIHARRLTNDWRGLLDYIHHNIDANKLVRENNLLPMYIRALGETGQLEEMLQFTLASKLSHHPQLAIFRNMCRMFAFTFCGQTRQVEESLRQGLSNLPEHLGKYWLATSLYAAGAFPEANTLMDELEKIASPGLAIAIKWRRENPPAAAALILTDSDRILLDQIEQQEDHERRFAHSTTGRRRAWVTYFLILANLIVFAIEWAKGAGPGHWIDGGTMSDNVLDTLGAMQPDVLQTHEFYRLFTANFLHYGYAHVTMNMLALLILGPFVEFSLGRVVYLLLYLVSGVGVMVTVLFLQLHHWMEPDTLVGASGAIMAIIGATAAILLRGWYFEQAKSALRRLGAVVMILALQVTFDHFTPQVSGAAHIAGMVWGFVLASMLPHHRKMKRVKTKHRPVTAQ
jgi:rhomboid protease GluP